MDHLVADLEQQPQQLHLMKARQLELWLQHLLTDSDTTNLTYSLATGNGTTDQHNSLFTVSGTQLLVASSTISYDTTTSLNGI